jgi:hypothetical protein
MSIRFPVQCLNKELSLPRPELNKDCQQNAGLWGRKAWLEMSGICEA